MKHWFTLLLFSMFSTMLAQQKEVLIIGTMHTVPSIVKRSYSPLLKKALKYQPEAILTEDIMPDDTLSLRNFTPNFLAKAEESAQLEAVDETRVKQLLSKSLTEMTHDDFVYLAKAFLQHKDRANYAYYNYLAEYGLQGSKKSLRNESDDVTHKLAIAMGLRQLLPIDSHHSDKEYNRSKYLAIVSGSDNGDLKLYNSLLKRNDRRQAFYGLTGRLGKFTNKPSTLEYYYLTNSIRYVKHPNEKTQEATALWDDRNLKMAEHIVQQMNATTSTRFVLIVGAGHVISLRNALNVLDPNIVVKTLETE